MFGRDINDLTVPEKFELAMIGFFGFIAGICSLRIFQEIVGHLSIVWK